VQIRWNYSTSFNFHVGNGVRVGSLFLPTLFNFFLNVLISDLRALDTGCHIDRFFVRIFLYDLDIFLLSPFLVGLQHYG
jgi:hypothetical protein